MMRLILYVFCLVGFGLIACVAPMAAAAQTAAALPAISPDQARAALDVLNDPAKRAAFAATLGAIVKAQPNGAAPGAVTATAPKTAAADAAAPAAAPPPETKVEGLTIPLAPDSLGAQVLVSASAFVNRLGTQAMDALDAVQSVPLLYGWAYVMATNPVAQALLLDVAWRAAVALGAAVVVAFALQRAMRRPIRSLEHVKPGSSAAGPADAESDASDDPVARAEAGDTEPPAHKHPSAWTLLARVPLVVARLLLDLIPVLGIVLIGHLIAGSFIGGNTVSRLVILAVIDSYAACGALLCVNRMLLSPETSRLRLFPLPDDTAAYLTRWVRRLILIAVLGYAVGEVGLLLGLSAVAHDLLEKAVGFLLHLSLAVMVVQKRHAVRDFLRAPADKTGFAAVVRNRFASIWHWLALFFLGAVWLVYAIEIRHGFAVLMHYFVVTALVVFGARLTLLVLLGVVDRVMRPTAGKTTISPNLDARLRIYHPAVVAVFRFTIYLLSVVGLFQLYGLNTFVWLTSSTLGLRIVSASVTILTTIILALAAWEIANTSIHNHLDRLQREAQMSRSARLRTLLPLLRTGLLISIAIFAGLTVLSEIGINIAPLLAGAGIIGVAIGFGSQKLVQDFITGIFLLLENAMQVGDWVTVSGLSGSVEALSVRTIRLRAGDGSVHLIPFSSVTSVTNVNRGLGNASVNVVVAYEEDTDRVSAELTGIVADMRNDPALSAMMLSDLQLWGVDKVDGAGVTIAGQVVCTDGGRWPVQREFNRRMKRRFQELGIRVYNPVQTIEFSAAPPPKAPLDKGVEKGIDHGHAEAAN